MSRYVLNSALAGLALAVFVPLMALAQDPFVDGKKHGQWFEPDAAGNFAYGPFLSASLAYGPYVDGMKHGEWIEHDAAGNFARGPYVDDKRHGWWTVRFPDGTVEAGPYVDGMQHGVWFVIIPAKGPPRLGEGPYVDGKRHGMWTILDSKGLVAEGPYVAGKRHGMWIERFERFPEPPVVRPPISGGFPGIQGEAFGVQHGKRRFTTTEEMTFEYGKRVR